MNYILKYHKTVLIIFVVTALSLAKVTVFEPEPLTKIPHFDKLVHFLMYFAMSFILLFEHDIYNEHVKPGIKLLVLPFIWGGLMELAQYLLTDNRTAEWLDLLANSVGILVSYFIYLFTRNTKWMNELMVFPFKKPL